LPGGSLRRLDGLSAVPQLNDLLGSGAHMAAREETFARSVAGATLMVLAACGGGGNGGKEAFVKAANAVCARSTERVKALGPTADQPAMIARFQQLSAIVRDEAEAIRQLSSPRDDAGVL